MAGPAGIEPTLEETPTVSPFKTSSLHQYVHDFQEFCKVDLVLSPRTINSYRKVLRAFLTTVNQDPQSISDAVVRTYLSRLRDTRSLKTYTNHLITLKRFFRDFLDKEDVIASFRFPSIPHSIKSVPSKEKLQKFFNAIPPFGKYQGITLQPKYQAFFLLVVSSGLRFTEALTLTKANIDFEKRMVIPNSHNTRRTKNSWITFYNEECSRALTWLANLSDTAQMFPCTRSVREAFKKAEKKTGIKITPQVLREWFCCEMGRRGVPDRYIDAFCGRVPRSILARHYTDFSPERLKEIYDQANLKVIS